MGAFKELSKNFFKDIVKAAKNANYSESNIIILSGDEERLKKEFPTVYKNLLSCNHNRDKRTYIEYGQDLVASWLFEDSLVSSLKSKGIGIELSGADNNREILATSKVSSNSDTTINVDGTKIQMELMSDYTGYWARTLAIDLRDEKYNKLKKSNSLFLGISTSDKKFILLDFRKDISHTYHKSHKAYGGKPCYTININSSDLKEFKIDTLISKIKEIL